MHCKAWLIGEDVLEGDTNARPLEMSPPCTSNVPDSLESITKCRLQASTLHFGRFPETFSFVTLNACLVAFEECCCAALLTSTCYPFSLRVPDSRRALHGPKSPATSLTPSPCILPSTTSGSLHTPAPRSPLTRRTAGRPSLLPCERISAQIPPAATASLKTSTESLPPRRQSWTPPVIRSARSRSCEGRRMRCVPPARRGQSARQGDGLRLRPDFLRLTARRLREGQELSEADRALIEDRHRTLPVRARNGGQDRVLDPLVAPRNPSHSFVLGPDQ